MKNLPYLLLFFTFLNVQFRTEETLITLESSGNLIITDTQSGSPNDALTFTRKHTHLRITDPNKRLGVSGSGLNLIDDHTVEIPLSSITGNIIIDTQSGNDSLNLNANLNLSGSQGIQIRGATTIHQNAVIGYADGTMDFQASGDIILTKNAALNGKGKGDVILKTQNRIEMQGAIQNGGDVFLIAQHVDNRGTIMADGHVGLAGGNEVLLKASGDDRLAVRLTDKDGRIDQSGLIEAAKIELRTAGNNPYALAYQWIDCENGNTPIAGATQQSFAPTGVKGSYAVQIITAEGCTLTSDCIPYFDTTTLLVAEGISPNGDGVNDTWVIQGIENHPNAVIYVYNRSGEVVFSSLNGYNNDWRGNWNETGRTLPSAPYFYTLDRDADGKIDDYGWIYIKS